MLREFKKGDLYFNYGCFPQTWEDPTHYHPDAEGCRGDNDPLDVCEIGARIVDVGAVRPVKVLGILMMIDEGETDWKIVVIDKDDNVRKIHTGFAGPATSQYEEFVSGFESFMDSLLVE